jgi:hypothetical protein
VAAWVAGMFCNFYFVKNHKNVKNLTNSKAKEKICADFESSEL